MDKTIIVALIGAFTTILATILSPILAAYYKKKPEYKKYKNISNSRHLFLEGHWSGFLNQASDASPDGEELNLPLEITFYIEGYRLVGTGEYFYKENKTIVTLEGYPINENHFKIEYRDKNPAILRYGYLMIKLSADSKNITGRVLGYAAEMESLITGVVTLTKE